jgi:hypothetical protein
VAGKRRPGDVAPLEGGGGGRTDAFSLDVFSLEALSLELGALGALGPSSSASRSRSSRIPVEASLRGEAPAVWTDPVGGALRVAGVPAAVSARVSRVVPALSSISSRRTSMVESRRSELIAR